MKKRVKRSLTVLLALSLIFSASSFTYADNIAGQTPEYVLYPDEEAMSYDDWVTVNEQNLSDWTYEDWSRYGEAKIKLFSYNGSDSKLIIPSKISGNSSLQTNFSI